MAATLTIDHLGDRGDGICAGTDGPVFVPGALPGEEVTVSLGPRKRRGRQARLDEIGRQCAERSEAPCGHFLDCGACVAQHMSDALYGDWKRARLIRALARRGLDTLPVEPLIRLPAASRRVAQFATRAGRLGFNARGSSRIVNLEECHVLTPSLLALIVPLRRLFRALNAPGLSDCRVTETDSGLDVLIEGGLELGLGVRAALVEFARDHDLARLSCRYPGGAAAETVIERRPEFAIGWRCFMAARPDRVGGQSVEHPSGEFWQQFSVRTPISLSMPP